MSAPRKAEIAVYAKLHSDKELYDTYLFPHDVPNSNDLENHPTICTYGEPIQVGTPFRSLTWRTRGSSYGGRVWAAICKMHYEKDTGLPIDRMVGGSAKATRFAPDGTLREAV